MIITYNRIALPFMLLLALALIACQQSPDSIGPKAEIGQPAPDFVLQDTTGKSWNLSELKDKVVFVNFWATWCPPCREEMPSMEQLHKNLASEGFQMLAILYEDDPGEAAALVNGYGYTFPVLIDPDGKTVKAYGLTGIPETFIVNTEGILVEKFIGPRNWNTKNAREIFKRYLP